MRSYQPIKSNEEGAVSLFPRARAVTNEAKISMIRQDKLVQTTQLKMNSTSYGGCS